MTVISPKKLIEVALPLDAINVAAAREKSIRHGHPSTLHLWWARRPLAAARAVIFSQLVHDPEDLWRCQNPGQEPNQQVRGHWTKARAKLFKIIEDLVLWENTTNETVLTPAREAIRQSWRETCELNKDHPEAKELFAPDKMPGLHDPFAGGGSIPLEAQRLGLEAYASDLNPVAVLINKAMIEIPPKFAGKPPVHPGARASRPQEQPQLFDSLSPTDLPDTAWHSRGYLPHVDHPGLIQSITFRLADSVPAQVILQWKMELDIANRTDVPAGARASRPLAAKNAGGTPTLPEAADDSRLAQLREQISVYEDAGHGECLLNQPAIGQLVNDALLHFDGQRYRLLAWCVMPNHVHVLIETFPGFPLADVVQSWKSFTAKAANKLLGRKGVFWAPDYYDRFIRNAEHYDNVVHYFEENPVKSGLVKNAADWKYSSAGGRASRPLGVLLDVPKNAGGTPAVQETWVGAAGLVEDVRRYGKWMRDEAFKRIGYLYPPIEITKAIVKERPDLMQYEGEKLTVIAWLWARTVKSPNPAFTHVEVPLATTFILSSKEGKEAYVQPVIGKAGYSFTMRVGKPPAEAKAGTSAGKRQAFRCLMSNVPMDYDYIREEGKAGRMSQKLMAIVAEGTRGRVYLAPTTEHETIAAEARPTWKPDCEMPKKHRNFQPPVYGMNTLGDLFTPRQLFALTTFTDLIGEARDRIRRDAIAAGLADNDHGLDAAGSGANAYAEAVSVYLAFVVSSLTDRLTTLCTWDSGGPTWGTKTRSTFSRQALPMSWDFAEVNPLSTQSGSIENSLDYTSKGISVGGPSIGNATQADATRLNSHNRIISTDPPYYDNIGYADLSDFFYVWLRRSLRAVYPNLLATISVPKSEELVATPNRHGTREKAENFFLDGMTQAMHCLAVQAHPAAPITIYYAFKQSETETKEGTSSTGWESFLAAVLKAGLALSGTWPMRTELSNRMVGSGTNALASSIILVCRPRQANAGTISRRQFVRQLDAALPLALDAMTRESEGLHSPVAPVDLSQAIIGPGMAIFSRYDAVLEADGKPMTVKTALQLINRFLAEDDFDADTQFCLHWFEQHGWETGKFGEADVLSRSKGTSVGGVQQSGVIESGGGNVRLLKWKEYPADWDPTTDTRLPIWEALHQLIRAYNTEGDSGAALVLKGVEAKAEAARQLAYRLYTLCERRGWPEDARAYNEVVTGWSGIESAAAKVPSPTQGSLFEE